MDEVANRGSDGIRAAGNSRSLDAFQVLVVDDNALVRDMLDAILSQIGVAQIALADGADSALAMFRQDVERFDVVFCDLQMPGKDGIELIRDIAALRQGASMVLMSGEDGSVLHAAGDLATRLGLHVAGTVAKPFSIETVRDALLRSGETPRAAARRPQPTVEVAELLRAIEAHEIVPFYQPKVALATRDMAGVEALARWRHPERGMIPPDRFIPVAEEHGLIDRLTDTMLAQAIAQSRQWATAKLPSKISVNLSVDSLDRLDLPEHVAKAVAAAGLDPACIVLEVTESRFTDNPTSLIDITARLRLKRFELSIDDFGTGFSGLRQLQRLPFTELKIDRAFVSGACRDHRARMILESSVELARKLDMTIVAEGVETQADWDLVAALGCDLAQGYFISPPLPAEDIPGWLEGWRSRR